MIMMIMMVAVIVVVVVMVMVILDVGCCWKERESCRNAIGWIRERMGQSGSAREGEGRDK